MIEDWTILKDLESLNIDFSGIPWETTMETMRLVSGAIIHLKHLYLCEIWKVGGMEENERQEFRDLISKFKLLTELDLNSVTIGLETEDIKAILEELFHLCTISLNRMKSETIYMGIPKILESGRNLRSLTYTMDNGDVTGKNLYQRIRTSVLENIRHLPFQLNFVRESYNKLELSKEIVKSDSRIVEIKIL